MTSKGAVLGRVLDRQEQVREMTRAGMTADQIADILHTTKRTVVRDRRAAGCSQPAQNPLTEAEIAWARELLADGCSLKEAARTIGRSHSAVRRRFPGMGWTHREIVEFSLIVRTLPLNHQGRFKR